jgi:hypothetical protein
MWRTLSVAGLVLSAVGSVFAQAELPAPEVAAKPIDHPGFFVTNDALHPVPVVEQGTVDVNITNGELPVQVAERRQPLLRAINTASFGTERFHTFHFSVPEGKILVVESVSVSAVVESGQKVRALVTFQGGPFSGNDFLVANYWLTLEHVEGFGPGDFYTTSRSLAGYAGGEAGVIVMVERNSATGPGGKIEFSLSGYLIDELIPTAR